MDTIGELHHDHVVLLVQSADGFFIQVELLQSCTTLENSAGTILLWSLTWVDGLRKQQASRALT